MMMIKHDDDDDNNSNLTNVARQKFKIRSK